MLIGCSEISFGPDALQEFSRKVKGQAVYCKWLLEEVKN